jgi:hypothetical protein
LSNPKNWGVVYISKVHAIQMLDLGNQQTGTYEYSGESVVSRRFKC